MALLPIGVIAIYQTKNATDLADARLDVTYAALTAEAALPQRELIQRAFGASDALGGLLADRALSATACTAMLRAYQARHPEFTTVAYITPAGEVPCSSRGARRAVSDTASWAMLSTEIRPQVVHADAGRLSEASVLVVASPVVSSAGDWLGYATVSIPSERLRPVRREDDLFEPVQMLVFSDTGQILSDPEAVTQIMPFLPETVKFETLRRLDRRSALLQSRSGTAYRYVAAPIVRGNVFVLGVWPESQAASMARFPSEVFPILMWVASLIVAYFALDRMVLRHLRLVNSEMRTFGRDRVAPVIELPPSAPLEFHDLQSQFNTMARAVLHDEAELERAVVQKGVLLKEIHHRVKNNLQLISSIMNMQIRSARQPEVKSMLARTQDRILGLALIHRNLHEIEDRGKINAGRMLDDLLQQTLTSFTPGRNPVVDKTIEPVVLFPDQTVPLSLLFSELIGNSLKHASAGDGRSIDLTVRFGECDTGEVELLVENPSDQGGLGPGEGPGLGTRLITAFASQLAATIKTENGDGRHRVTVRFTPQEFQPSERDF